VTETHSPIASLSTFYVFISVLISSFGRSVTWFLYNDRVNCFYKPVSYNLNVVIFHSSTNIVTLFSSSCYTSDTRRIND